MVRSTDRPPLAEFTMPLLISHWTIFELACAAGVRLILCWANFCRAPIPSSSNSTPVLMAIIVPHSLGSCLP